MGGFIAIISELHQVRRLSKGNDLSAKDAMLGEGRKRGAKVLFNFIYYYFYYYYYYYYFFFFFMPSIEIAGSEFLFPQSYRFWLRQQKNVLDKKGVTIMFKYTILMMYCLMILRLKL